MIEASIDPYTVNYTLANSTHSEPGNFEGFIVAYFIVTPPASYKWFAQESLTPRGIGYSDRGTSPALTKGTLFVVAGYTSGICNGFEYSDSVEERYLTGEV